MFGPITLEHQKSIQDLRAALKSNADFQSITEPDRKCDSRLLRFLIARNSKVEDAKKMIEDHLAWRKEHGADEIRRQVIDKPVETGSFPHAEYFRPAMAGSWTQVVDGGLSRSGDVVLIDVIGSSGGRLDDTNKDEMDKLEQHHIGFFEARSRQLELLSEEHGKFVRMAQIRDMSNFSFIPKGNGMALAKRQMQLGLLNYPELAATALFVNAPTAFSVVFALFKPFIPDNLEKKLRFISGSGDYIASELLKYVRPRNVVAWNRLSFGDRTGDEIQHHIEQLERLAPAKAAWQESFERQVGARSTDILCFALTKALPTVQWRLREGGGGAAKVVVGKVFYVSLKQEAEGVHGKDVDVLQPGDAVDNEGGVARLPASANEALLVLVLDNSSSWLHGKTFQIIVTGGR